MIIIIIKRKKIIGGKKIHSFFSHVIFKNVITLFLVLLTAVKLEQADRRPSALRRVYVHVTTTTSTESAIYHCQLLSTTTAIVYHYYYYRYYYHYYYHYYYQSCYVSSWTNRTNRESALAGVTSLAEVLEQTILPSISFLHFFFPPPRLLLSLFTLVLLRSNFSLRFDLYHIFFHCFFFSLLLASLLFSLFLPFTLWTLASIW